MFTCRRSAGLILVSLLAIGCGSEPPPPPPAAGPTGPDVTELGDGSLIRAGGPAADPATRPAPPAPKPGEMTLPDGGGAWPWNLAPAPPAGPSRPVAIPGYRYAESTTSGVVVSPAAGRAVVLIGERIKDEEKMTRVVWCDVTAGKVLAEWKVKGIYAPLDLHADGHRVLAVRPPREGRTDLLELWTIEEPNQLRRQSWQPHDSPAAVPSGDVLVAADGADPAHPDPARDVRWAAFAGHTRVVSASRSGQVRVFDAGDLRRLGTIDAAAATPALTPDGAKVVFLTRAGAALLDPADAKVVGVRPAGDPPAEPVLAVSPDGKTLACAGNGKATFLDLTTGAVRAAAIPKLEVTRGGQRLGFGWAGNRHLLADRFLYDPAAAEPVWDYGHIDKVLPRGAETWAVLRPGRDAATLRSFVLPHPTAAAPRAGGKPGRSTLQANGVGDAQP